MGLLARGLIRKFLQKFLPKITDGHFDAVLILILVIIAALTVMKHNYEESNKNKITKDILEIKKRIPSKRIISLTSQQAMIDILKPFSGSIVAIRVVTGDVDSRDLAEQLKKVFEISGWEIPYFALVANGNYRKVFIRVKDSTHAPSRTLEIQKALQKAGFGYEVSSASGLNPNEVQICIGPE